MTGNLYRFGGEYRTAIGTRLDDDRERPLKISGWRTSVEHQGALATERAHSEVRMSGEMCGTHRLDVLPIGGEQRKPLLSGKFINAIPRKKTIFA